VVPLLLTASTSGLTFTLHFTALWLFNLPYFLSMLLLS
jgi:hypothetical protein